MNSQSCVIRRRSARGGIVALTCLVAALLDSSSPTASAESYQRISGEGSSWAANAIDAMRVNVQQFGITVDYNPSGSTAGRKNFLNGTVDFAASDIPFQFQPEDGSAPENPAPGSYAYMPVTAGGTAFMYNLTIAGQRVTNLRLSGENVAKIFTGAIATWNDPAIQADNPGLVMPARPIVPVVRSDGSGSSAQFTAWMIHRHEAIWMAYCNKSGRAPKCGQTSFYPTIPGMIAQAGDIGIAGYVQQGFAEGAIGYVNYSYALGAEFPVAKVLNAAGFYTEPTPENVAVSLLKARINTDESNPALYLTQQLDGVYTDTDPRSYQLSSYSYLILPTKVGGQFNEAKGLTLGAFSYYAMCQAQQQSASLGYSPMPVNLVTAGFEQILKIPGVAVQDINIASCKNPTFSADGTNVLANNAPQPKECDKRGSVSQCPDGTAGMANVPTTVAASGVVVAVTPAAGSPAPGAAAPSAGGAPAQASATPVAGGAATAPGASPSGGSNSPAGSNSPSGAAGGASTDAGDGSTQAGAVDASGAPITGADGSVSGGVTAAQSCDPDTGVCSENVSQAVDSNGQIAASAQTQASGPLVANTLPQTSRWGSASLIFLVILLVLALVLVPALAWRYFAASRPA
jgi:phosphate ABC transporter phosphate-binding protein